MNYKLVHAYVRTVLFAGQQLKGFVFSSVFYGTGLALNIAIVKTLGLVGVVFFGSLLLFAVALVTLQIRRMSAFEYEVATKVLDNL